MRPCRMVVLARVACLLLLAPTRSNVGAASAGAGPPSEQQLLQMAVPELVLQMRWLQLPEDAIDLALAHPSPREEALRLIRSERSEAAAASPARAHGRSKQKPKSARAAKLASEGLSLISEKGRVGAATEAFRQAAALAPTDPAIASQLAHVLGLVGREQEAIAVLESTVEMSTTEMQLLHIARGRQLGLQDRIEDALTAFDT